MSLQRFGKSLHSRKKNLWKHNLHNTGNVRVSLSPLSLLSTDNGRYSAGRFAWPTFLAACKAVFRSHLSDIAVYHRTWMLWGGWATQVAGWVRLHLLFTEPAQGDFTEVHLAGSSMPALLGSWALPCWGTDNPLPPKKGENTGFPVGSWKVLLSRHREMPAPQAKGEGYTRPTSARIQKHCLHWGHLCVILGIVNSPNPPPSGKEMKLSSSLEDWKRRKANVNPQVLSPTSELSVPPYASASV